MKSKNMAIIWIFVAAVIFVAGCILPWTDSGTIQNSPAATVSSQPPAHPQSLTDAQKAQAMSIAKDDPGVKDILKKPGYNILGGADYYRSEDALEASIVIIGGNTVNSDGSMHTPDQYTVVVDLDHGKVADMIHVAPSPLPTP